MSKITNDGLTRVWHRMLYSCTHMATVGDSQKLQLGIFSYIGLFHLTINAFQFW